MGDCSRVSSHRVHGLVLDGGFLVRIFDYSSPSITGYTGLFVSQSR